MTRLTKDTEHKINVIVGKRLQTIRKKLGLTQEEFAARIDISRRSYARCENGEAKITIAMILFISAMTGIPMEKLTGGIVKKEGKASVQAENDTNRAECHDVGERGEDADGGRAGGL